MRDFELPGRSEALGTNGMVASSHPLATVAALDVLRAGGNAVDAGVCAVAVLAVVEPAQTGLGGDCFALLMRRGKPRPVAINGSGWAPAAAELDVISRQCGDGVDPRSAHAVTVPGAVAAWTRLHADYGTMDFAQLLAPAITAAEDGYVVTERVARDWAKQVGKLQSNEAAAAALLLDGQPPPHGYVMRQPVLAATLRAIAEEGPSVFYSGWIAADMLETLQAIDGLHSPEDFAGFEAQYVEPICASYRGFDVWECPPNGQGAIPLLMLRGLERFEPKRWAPGSAARYHVQAELSRLAYAERDAFIGDPSAGGDRAAEMLTESRIDAMVERISLAARLADAAPIPLPAHRDTVFVSIVDRDLMGLAIINSIFDDFGSGILAPKSGILFHNRGCGFSLDAGHPNSIGGRRRPLHTIIPAIVARHGVPVMPFGVTGGHFQPFGQVQVLTNIIDHGLGVQAAIDQPRIFARGDVFEVEGTVPSAVVRQLADLGHQVTRAINPLGTAQAVWIDHSSGVLHGGADPRRDGIALGW